MAEHEVVCNPAELAQWLGESGPEDARQKLEGEFSQTQMSSLVSKDELLAWVAKWVHDCDEESNPDRARHPSGCPWGGPMEGL